MGFEELLAANRQRAASLVPSSPDGRTRAGLAVLTCMDARIDPLEIFGLVRGDAVVLRTPGAWLDDESLLGLALAVSLLGVSRIMILPHTPCVAGSEVGLEARAALLAPAEPMDAATRLARDVERVRAHPAISGRAEVGGFVFDMATGLVRPA